MLVLKRKENEKIRIGNDIVLTVVRTRSDRVRIGIEAPTDIQIRRGELNAKVTEADLQGASGVETVTRKKSDCPH